MAYDARLYDREYLARAYWGEGKSTITIAADLGVKKDMVRRALIAQSIPIRPRGYPLAARFKVSIRGPDHVLP